MLQLHIDLAQSSHPQQRYFVSVDVALRRKTLVAYTADPCRKVSCKFELWNDVRGHDLASVDIALVKSRVASRLRPFAYLRCERRPCFILFDRCLQATWLVSTSRMHVIVPGLSCRYSCLPPRPRLCQLPRSTAASVIRCTAQTAPTSRPGSNWRDKAKPIKEGSAYPARQYCSHCGLCDTYYVAHVKDACAFLGDGELL